jgi:hypothetical protein
VASQRWQRATLTRCLSKPLAPSERAAHVPAKLIASSALAPLHGLSYITPSLIALAARKIYPHRINLTSPENERSMQWGSSLEAVKAVLEGVTVEEVVEEVLQSVEVPL